MIDFEITEYLDICLKIKKYQDILENESRYNINFMLNGVSFVDKEMLDNARWPMDIISALVAFDLTLSNYTLKSHYLRRNNNVINYG